MSTKKQQGGLNWELWSARLQRLGMRSALKIHDIERALSWHLGGGRRFFQRHFCEMVQAHRWCFIVGCNNSGTSLLQSILERAGPISTFPFEGQRYTTVFTRATKRGYERVWSEYLDDLRLTSEDSLVLAPRLLHDWMLEFPLPINELIVEKTTPNAVRMTWLQKVFPRSYFIGLVRNGYAVVEGIRRKGAKSVERGARHWNLVNKIMMRDASQINYFLEMRYEDLVDNPTTSAKRLGQFLGVDSDKLRQAMNEHYAFATIRGQLQQRVRNLNPESIARLTEDEIRRIHNEAAEMLDYFSYTPAVLQAAAKMEPRSHLAPPDGGLI